MASDQVRYSDLFEDKIVEEINNLTASLKGVKEAIANAKSEANGFRDLLSGIGTATRDQQQVTAQDASAVEELSKKIKALSKEEERLNKAIDKARDEYDKLTEGKLRYKKLTMEEVAEVEKLRQALRGGSDERIEAVKSIDMQSKSYNELYQTYNAIKEALNGMTVAERSNTEAGKEMVSRAKEIRDVLNNMQQETGVYTLNVGNYASALNGLQLQTQQVLREIPSAQNLSQFFLAISNNIPMFTDALTRYNKGLPEIRSKLAAVRKEIERQKGLQEGLNENSTSYQEILEKINNLRKKEEELQGMNVKGWRAVLKAVGSWQTLLIAGLLILRKLPDIVKDVAKWWDRWRNGVKEVKNEITGVAAIAKLRSDVIKKTADETTELKLVVDKLRGVKRGTDEWIAGIETVNKMTNSNLNNTTSTIAEVEKVTKAYIKQADQLAKNAILSDMIGKSMANAALREVAYNPGDVETARQALGIELDSKEYEELQRLVGARNKAIRAYKNKELTTSYTSGRGGMLIETVDSEEVSSMRRKKEMDDAVQEYKNFVNKILGVLSDDAISRLKSQYESVNPFEKTKNGKTYSAKDVDLLDSELLDKDAVIELESSYQQQLAMLEQQRQKELLILKEKYEQEREDLEYNKEHQLITEQEYAEKSAALDRNYQDLTREDYEGNFQKMGIIQRKYWNLRNRLAEKEANRQEQEEKRANEAALREVQDEEKNFKHRQEIEKRKFELTKHSATEEKKFVMEQQMELLQWRIDHAAELGISDDMLEVMKSEYEQMKKMYDLGKYSDGGKNIKGNATSIMDLLFPDLSNDQQSALKSVFDQAKEALTSWMDAKQKAADQAKELADDEVSAAENALNREIELREQGYANDVAIKEKELEDAKERQKKAAELQKKAQKETLLANSAMEASSMAVAIANLFKDFPLFAAIPLAGVLIGAYSYAKLQAFSAINSTQYRNGGYMLLNGGSHQSGHDVSLGVGPDGSSLRAEGGEYFAVINKSNSRKYGREIPGIVNALNGGTFEERYIKTSDAVGMLPRIAMGGDGVSVDLSAVESGVGELVRQGEKEVSVEGGYRVERYKNRVRRVRI